MLQELVNRSYSCMHSTMEPNYFVASPPFPYNIHDTNPNLINPNWNNDSSYATPVSGAFYNTTATSSWAHTVPSLMPWVSESNPDNTEQVMRFTAPFPPDPCTSQTATSWELFNNLGTSKTNANLHLKRRGDFEDAPISHKQYITEEKMAARLQELHISNQYTPPEVLSKICGSNGPKPPANGTPPVKTLRELEAFLGSDSSNSPCKGSIILAPEIKMLVEPEKLFAQTFVNQVERPSMAVVLWKPPQGSIQKVKSDSLQNSSSEPMNDSENNISCSSSSLLAKEFNNNSSPQLQPPPDLLRDIPSSTASQLPLPSVSLPLFPACSTSEDTDFIMEA